MKRLVATLAVLALAAAVLFVAAAVYEVTSIGSRLTGRIGRLEGPLPHGLSRSRPAPAGPGAPPAGPTIAEPVFTSVRVTLTEADVGDLLRRSATSLGGALTRAREVAVRLGEGQAILASRNRVAVLGIPLADYGGHSAWALAALPDGVGVALRELRVAGLPVPGAAVLLRRLSGRSRDGWVVVPTGPRRIVERIDITPGRLTVSGRAR
jgi:hypothetical protein